VRCTILAIHALALALAGCVSQPMLSQRGKSMRLHTDQKAMQAEVLKWVSSDQKAMQAKVLKWVSRGMPIEQARRIMEDKGFRCSECSYSDLHYLNCIAEIPRDNLQIDTIDIAIYYVSGHVIDVKTICSSTGPYFPAKSQPSKSG